LAFSQEDNRQNEMTRLRTIFFCGVTASLAFYAATTPAHTQIDDESRSVTLGCHDAIRQGQQSKTFDAGMCLGILKGLHYLSRDICIPPATSLGQIADVVSKYVDSHAAKMHDDFRETSLQAMRSAWPCRQRHDI
jgi:hypothetical protein